jgi:transposase
MLDLSADPEIAGEELRGLIFYLTTFSYIDGDFDPQELTFIEGAIREVIERRVDAARPGAKPERRRELVDALPRNYERLFAATKAEVARLLAETVAGSEARETFVGCRLKQR